MPVGHSALHFARANTGELRVLRPLWAGTNIDGSLVMTNRQTIASALLLLLPAYGCSSKAEFTPMGPFEEPKHVQSWANSASAVGVYSNVFQVLAVADGHGTFADASCPVIDDDGTTWNAHGACTDSEGTQWQGQASVVRDGAERALTLDAFQGNDGSVTVHEAEVDLHEFEAHLVLGGFTTVDYRGSVQGGYSGPTLWNGSGQVTRDGFVAPNGTVDATTLDEKVDNDVCPGQPVSGRTTITSGSDEAVITYDGESDCDDAQAAMLSVNGEERGTVDGITCTVTAPAGSKSAGGATSLACCVTAWVLRRRARRAPQASPASSIELRCSHGIGQVASAARTLARAARAGVLGRLPVAGHQVRRVVRRHQGRSMRGLLRPRRLRRRV